MLLQMLFNSWDSEMDSTEDLNFLVLELAPVVLMCTGNLFIATLFVTDQKLFHPSDVVAGHRQVLIDGQVPGKSFAATRLSLSPRSP